MNDSELVKEIVRVVYGKLSPTERIGTYSRLLEIENLICHQPWDVRSLGMWGMPGIGKTTLAKAVFDQIHSEYDASCFIDNFDEGLSEGKPQRLLKEKILNIVIKNLGVSSTYTTRLSLLKDKLRDTKILLVLDDVRNPLVAESFLGRLDWFGHGSLIIITSRYKQVFALCQVNQIYKVQGLNEQEALQLFSQTVFEKDVPEQDDLELSKKVIRYANGNPLALRIYGQELMMKGNKLSEMESGFLGLKQRPPQKIQDMLKSVYTTLGDNEKHIFLSIACFFRGESVDYVAELLKGCGYFPRVGIDILVDKCLLAISENILQMNDLIQDIFRHIIIRDGLQMKCTTLSQPSRIRYLLGDDELKGDGQLEDTPKYVMVAEDIQGICLDASNVVFDVKPDAFTKMTNLRYLKIYKPHSENVHGLKFIKGLNYLPSKLRLLYWENYPFESLPENFDLRELVELNMPYSDQIKKLRAGTENLEKLKRVGLRHSPELLEFSIHVHAQNIEKIDLQGCTRLESFPAMTKLHDLQVLNLSGCSNIKTVPGLPPSIRELYLAGTRIRELPEIPKSLEFLNAHDCGHLKSVRLDFKQLPRHYTFSNCFSLSSETTADFLEKCVSRVIMLTKEENQERIKAHRFNICFAADSCPRMNSHLRAGSFATVELTQFTQKALSGFAMSVLVSFRDNLYNAVGLGIMCICTWGTKKANFRRIERVFKCWAPTQAPNVKKDHIFVFYDSEIHPGAAEPADSDDEIKFEFHTMSWENKLLNATSCMVIECGVQVIMAPTGDKLVCGIIKGSEDISIIEEDTIVIEEETLPSLGEPEETSISFIEDEYLQQKPEATSCSSSSNGSHKQVKSKGIGFWKWITCFPHKKLKSRKIPTRILQESKEKGKLQQVDDDDQIKHVHPRHSICSDCRSVMSANASDPEAVWPYYDVTSPHQHFCCTNCRKTIATHMVVKMQRSNVQLEPVESTTGSPTESMREK
ncbi:hypothetical protein N665_0579s0008 [Sinapis alba]|nr:hypothetical protein N665_0579s0008 [Sinapis alba]